MRPTNLSLAQPLLDVFDNHFNNWAGHEFNSCHLFVGTQSDIPRAGNEENNSFVLDSASWLKRSKLLIEDIG